MHPISMLSHLETVTKATTTGMDRTATALSSIGPDDNFAWFTQAPSNAEYFSMTGGLMFDNQFNIS